MSYDHSKNLTLSRTAQRQMCENLVDWWGQGVAVAAKILPFNGNNAATLTGAVDTRNFKFLMAILKVGVIDETVDFELKQSDSSGGSYASISGKALTQIAATGDNKIHVIFVRDSELTSGNHFVKGLVSVGNGTSSLIDVTILGIGPTVDPSTVDDSAVTQIVGGTIYTGSTAKFYTTDFTPTKDTVIGDLDIADLGSAGTALSAWEGPINLDDGSVAMHHNIDLVAGASPTEETIRGIVVLDGTNILHCENFAVPVPIVAAGDGIVYELLVPLPDVLTTNLS